MDNEIKEQTRSVNNQDCVLNDIMNLQNIEVKDILQLGRYVED